MKTLALTVIYGDGNNATIGIFDEEGNYERKCRRTNVHLLAIMVRYAHIGNETQRARV